jgi:XRE family transcriptional regulator, aerobic/anaerobic benzoate catabolism transcriptional regulator
MKNNLAVSTRLAAERPQVTEAAYLKRVGARVREARARRGMTRKILARDSGVSERYLAQLESGQGNVSILLLRDIAHALDLPLEVLVLEGQDPPLDLVHATALLKSLRAEQLLHARQLLVEHFGGADQVTRRSRIALVGLRGAGKSALGARLAEKLGVPFIELDRVIEQVSGVSLGAIFDLYGQSGFRRLERRCLEQVLEQNPKFVLATGGSLVSEPETFERLITMCYTVWLRATPEEHMQRVLAQGDVRPMADNRESMSDLRRILSVREPLYRMADTTVDTASHTLAESFKAMLKAVRSS